ncbi:hypothetical protein A3H89_01710 [Candidatus Amesbacteria bacterium RIFCSPLOWO2_02_FULL_48_11]|uniref:Uncharacterized protein n=1 Tax=Candidatus Amesbacteria bacterium RIFCSPHIGHO2_12_FULL_48_14 TaxID=1797257 RepID=A0A1F4ZB76_9BACT|nr:MAG: hypothetical protein A2V48_04140 [Candidatus Amesbacteria bacterium RBG_19FT_COMBO_48_16]OGC96509.1 MAG: hypothetical protein A3C34_04750 [Candidatus Amesbacteria bacterium RIFCSPHIGHO2_02_FULL_48_21]OGC98984.1 MAG: hypothetical protein A2W16_00010 [Candidatus Amesbacteria bacterium RBG_16_48_31]OGD00634.1 MAG: hypothetical protein A2702_00530 [Candidatus Amesbacteria bacterium RIFCSPHIGHO2_01_FULL_48_75]OGD03166.1 MAG: hypothetical protein A3E17_04075 [Candidatus Amesbacteria bacterium
MPPELLFNNCLYKPGEIVTVTRRGVDHKYEVTSSPDNTKPKKTRGCSIKRALIAAKKVKLDTAIGHCPDCDGSFKVQKIT